MNLISTLLPHSLAVSSSAPSLTRSAAGSSASAPISSGSKSSSNAGASQDPAAVSDLATQGTFITLLVAQLENQDPMNPTDATTFVTQLAQFTQVDQMVGIAKNVAAIADDLTGATSSRSTPPANSKP